MTNAIESRQGITFANAADQLNSEAQEQVHALGLAVKYVSQALKGTDTSGTQSPERVPTMNSGPDTGPEFIAQLNKVHPGAFTSAQDITTTLAGMGIEVDPALASAIFATSKLPVPTGESPLAFVAGVTTATLESLIFSPASPTGIAPGQTTPGVLGLVATPGKTTPLRLQLDANASAFDRLRFSWSGDATPAQLASRLQSAGYGDHSANQNELTWLTNAFGTSGKLSWENVSTLARVDVLQLGATERPPTEIVDIDAAIDQALSGSSITVSRPAYADLQSNPYVVDASYEVPSASKPYAEDNALSAQLQSQGITVDPTQLGLYRYSQASAAGVPTLTISQVGQAVSDGTFKYSISSDGKLQLQLADPTAVLREAITASNWSMSDPLIPALVNANAEFYPRPIEALLPELIRDSSLPAGLVTLINSLTGTNGSNFSLDEARSLILNFGNVQSTGTFGAADLLAAVDAGALGVGVNPSTGKLTIQNGENVRAALVVKHLSNPDGTPAPGADLQSILALDLSVEQADNVLSLDPQAVRVARARGGPLAEVLSLTPEALTKLNAMEPGYVQWLQKLGQPTLTDIVNLSGNDGRALSSLYKDGFWYQPDDGQYNGIQSTTDPISFGGEWVVTFSTPNSKIIVVQGDTPNLFAQVTGLIQERRQAVVSEVRDQNGVFGPGVDALNLGTNAYVDPKNPSAGYLSVGELAIKTMLEQTQAGIDSGQIAHNDPRAQLLRALQASSAVNNGYSLLPYAEEPRAFGTTRRIYPGGEKNPTFVEMSELDVAELLNADAVNARVQELMADPTNQQSYQAALESAWAQRPGREDVADRLFSDMTSVGYTDTIQELKDRGLGYWGEQMVQRDLASLTLLDPARAAEAAQLLQINALSADMQKLMDDPSLIDVGTFEAALVDSITIGIQSLRSGASIVRHGSQTNADLIKYLEGVLGDKKSVTALAEVIRQATIDAKTTGGVGNLGSFTQAQFDEAMAKTYVPLELRGKVSGFFGTTQKFGVWGSIGGAGALASFGYKLSQGAWGPDSTHIERWGAARDIISFLSVIGHVAKSSAGLVDYMLGSKLNANGTGDAWRALGLDQTLPEVWGKKSFLPNQMNYEELFKSWNKTAAATGTLTAAQTQTIATGADNLGAIWAAKDPVPTPVLASRIGITALKVLGTVTDLAGIADIVMGGIGLKKAIHANDTPGIVGNSLQIGGGTALTAAGAIGTAVLFGAAPAAIAAAVAPLFWVGAVLALGGFLAIAIGGAVKRHNALQKTSGEQSQWFTDLARDGLADADWANKLEYYRYAWTIYGNDNTNAANQSYIDFQRAEWEHFRNQPTRDGSSMSRLNGGLHIFNVPGHGVSLV